MPTNLSMEESKTGTYRYNSITKQIEKISDRIPILHPIADWKRQMNPSEEIRRANEVTGKRKLREIYSKL